MRKELPATRRARIPSASLPATAGHLPLHGLHPTSKVAQGRSLVRGGLPLIRAELLISMVYAARCIVIETAGHDSSLTSRVPYQRANDSSAVRSPFHRCMCLTPCLLPLGGCGAALARFLPMIHIVAHYTRNPLNVSVQPSHDSAPTPCDWAGWRR